MKTEIGYVLKQFDLESEIKIKPSDWAQDNKFFKFNARGKATANFDDERLKNWKSMRG